MAIDRRAVLFVLAAAGLAAGCSQLPSPASGAPDAPAVRRAYARALRDAERPKPGEVSHELVALVPENQELSWDEDGRVLMVTWTKAGYYDDAERFAPGKSFPLAVESWFTAAPFVQRFCSGLGLDEVALVRRLQQRIGLPPDNAHDSFLEVWVDPADLFRPCVDAEVTDRSCRLDAYGDGGGKVKKRHRLPRACDPRRARPGESPADPEQLRWMCGNWKGSFENDELYDNYPWTGLGYTYDWGSRNPRGASEFVAPQGSVVVFHSLRTTAEYCGEGDSGERGMPSSP